MRQKKDWRDSLLTIAVLFSLFRGDIDEYMRGSFASLPEVHEILLGQSAALTETQFHNLFNSFEGHRVSDVHPKNLDIDWHHRSVFTDLHALYSESNQNPGEVTAFLLDRLEASPARPYPYVNLVQNPSNTNNNANSNNTGNTDGENNNDNNNNVDSSGGSNLNEDDNVVGAVAEPQVEELSPEDMDLIETLWRQDIDMGLSREDAQSFGYSKPDHTEKLKKDTWDNIDAESGEFMSIPVQSQENLVNFQQHPQPPQGLTVQTQQNLQQQQPALQPSENNNLSLEECLRLIDDTYSPTATSPSESSSTFQSQLSPQEAEQRWHDLASIPELSNQLHNASTEAPAATSQFQQQRQESQVIMNMTQPADNPFMMNATTNGNVNLQNATNNIVPQALPQVGNSTVLQPPSVPSNEIPTQPTEIFSPLSEFRNLSLNATSPAAGSQAMNYSEFLLLERRRMEGSFQHNHANFSAESGSLLLELLNEGSVDEVNMDYDEHIQSLANAFDVDVNSIEDSDSGRCSRSPFDDLSDAGSPFSDHGSSEGATGYNSSLEGDHLKGATGGYGYGRRRGERQYTGDNSGDGYSGHPPNMDNIKHNHTYAGSSGTQNGKTGGGNNGTSRSNDTEQQRLSRDQRRAQQLQIPISIDKVINLPVDAFNELMKNYDLNDAQTTLIRDIRRRGKNKVAAQNCRKRKIDAIAGIAHTIQKLKSEKNRLVEEKNMIDKETKEVRDQYRRLYNNIFQNLRDDSGDPVDPNEFTLQQMPDGTMFLVPRNSTSAHKEDEHCNGE